MDLMESDIMKVLVKKYPINAKTEKESEIMFSIPEWCNQNTGLPLTDGEGAYTYALGEIPDDIDLEGLSLENFKVEHHELETVNADGTIESHQVFKAIYKK